MLIDANAWTGRKIGEAVQDKGVLDALDVMCSKITAKPPLTFVSDNELAIRDTFSTPNVVSRAYTTVPEGTARVTSSS